MLGQKANYNVKRHYKEMFSYFTLWSIYEPEKEMAPHSSSLAWRIPWTEEPGGLRLWGCTESDMTEAT